MAILVFALLLFVVMLRYGALDKRWRDAARRVVRPAFALGGIGFAAGFFGPMVFRPDANQGPLLGIFITGPGGFLFGLAYGVVRELSRRDSAKAQLGSS